MLLMSFFSRSPSESFMQLLVAADRLLAVVGQRSAGVNGNISGLQLPGGFGFTYTGMDLRNPDGSVFSGVGIAPTVEAAMDTEDIADGVDTVLLEAIDVFEDELDDDDDEDDEGDDDDDD